LPTEVIKVNTNHHPYYPLSDEHGRLMNRARAQHETVNGRLKVWKILKDTFRQPLAKHHIAFWSMIILEQIEMENDHPSFQVQDLNDPMDPNDQY
jgi:predicted ATP-dependent Lon-type protease